MGNKEKFMRYVKQRLKRKEQKKKADADGHYFDNMEKIKRRLNSGY